jgi:hypothetical protein
MDSAAAAQSLTWTQAGTKSAEAGFHDPELGWVSVRADASSGGIHAALVPSSTEAAVALGGHLEGLNNYLAEHHNIVESLSVAAPESRPFNSGSDRGSDSSQQSSAQQEPNQGTGQQTSQGFGQNSSQRQSPSAVIQSSMGASTAAGLDTSPATAGFLSTTSESGTGTHISVLA